MKDKRFKKLNFWGYSKSCMGGMRLNMSKTFLRLLISIIIILFIIMVWGIYQNKSNGSTIEDKVAVEIKFLDENITDIINYLNNITINMYSVNKKEDESQNQQSENTQSSGGQSSGGGDSNQGSGGESAGGGGAQGGENGKSGESSGGELSGGSNQGTGGQSEGSSQGGEKQDASEQELAQYQIQKNNILNTERKVTNWEKIKNDIEKLYTSLVIIELDLEESGIEEATILGFSKLLDNTVISIKQEDKQKSIENLANLYKYIPQFYSKNDDIKYVYQTKAEILEAYSLVETEAWEQIESKISSAQEKFIKVTEKSNKKITTNKVNLLLKDLKEGIKLKDKEIFYIKYKNILDKMGNLC